MEKKSKQTKEELKQNAIKKAEELSISLGKKVYGDIVNTEPYGSEDGEWVIFYIKAPSLYEKAKIIDTYETQNRIMTGFELIRTNILKEHSDPRAYTFGGPNSDENVLTGIALYIMNKGYVFSVIDAREEAKKKQD